MKSKLKLFLGLVGLLLASACAHNKFELQHSEAPPKALPGVLLEVEGNDPYVNSLLGVALRTQLEARDIKVESGSVPEQGARLTIDVESLSAESNAYFRDGWRYYAPVSRLVVDVEFTAGGKSRPYLSIELVLDSIIHGQSMEGFKSIETRDELVTRFARFLSKVYLNALGGEPEPIDGVWADALGGSVAIAFREDTAKHLYTGVPVRGQPQGPVGEVYTMRTVADTATDPHKRKGSYKLWYLSGEETWLPADFGVYGCLMVIDPTAGALTGKAFLVKEGARCFAD